MKRCFAYALFFCMFFLFCGCGSIETTEAKISDIDFTVLSPENIQQDIQKIIDEKKEEPFELAYSDGNFKYIVVGYGKQETGGCSIQVKELYETANTIVVKTTLLGPQEDTGENDKNSFPYIVLKMENLDKKVVFSKS